MIEGGESVAYSELIKSFNRIRDYMREFYVYGFKSREEYTRKSARSYDNERRRMESWLGEYMQFRQTSEGKNVFLSIDSRLSRRNPLYTAWKAKSFTDGDITLYFLLLDILHSPEVCLSLNELTEAIDDYLSAFEEPKTFDASTVRKKLNEYIAEGIIRSEKRGKTLYYRRAEAVEEPDPELLTFFSETAPCGVVGSYLLDRKEQKWDHFAFKHHYITGALDSEIVCSLFLAMSEKRVVTLETVRRGKDRASEQIVIPLQLRFSAQNGRQYLMAYDPKSKRVKSYRVDFIESVKAGETAENFDSLRAMLRRMEPHIWGVSMQGTGKRLEHVEFTVRYGDKEEHIHQRLEREKRCGRVERLDANASRFSAEVYDANELVPWIRSFICRITELHFSNEDLERQFREDLQTMYALYGLEGGEQE